VVHHRLDHQRGFKQGCRTKQIIGAVRIFLGDPDPGFVFVPYLARLDDIVQQRFADAARSCALAHDP
jgi:hypothetical protein